MVETVMHKHEQSSKKTCKQLHQSAPRFFCLRNEIIGGLTDGVGISNMLRY
jgi:hypothetical protein